MSRIDTIIIGAGPYGLSLAAHLKAQDLPFVILGTPMDHWQRNMPPNMVLRSEPFASSFSAPGGALTMEDYCREIKADYRAIGLPLPIKTFLDYAQCFRTLFVGKVIDTQVVRLARDAGGFQLDLADGERLTAARVVLATGPRAFRHVPAVLSHLPASHMSHSSDLGDLERFRNLDVTVVGAGQSALELAALLHEQGTRVQILARCEKLSWNGVPEQARSLWARIRQPDSGLGPGWRGYLLSRMPWLFRALPKLRRQRMVARSWGPSGAWWLKDRIVGHVDVQLQTEIAEAHVEGSRLRLTVTHAGQRRDIVADHVIAATGFKTDMARLGFLSPAIRAELAMTDGAPELGHHFESSIKGLFVIGQASAQSFGPVMRFVWGAQYAVPKLARHLVATAVRVPAAGEEPAAASQAHLRKAS